MKKLLLIALAFTMSYAINAQVKTPAPSPSSKVEQKVGLTDVTLEYSRPGVKGRVIFGDLVPFGKNGVQELITVQKLPLAMMLR